MSTADRSLGRRRALVLSQVYYPDVVAVAQHVTEYAEALAEAGWEVQVLSSRRAYDSPQKIYSRRETHNGVEIIRLMGTGFGKKAKWCRAIDFASWITLCAVRLLFTSRVDVVVSLTVPPLISFLGALFCSLKRCSLLFWVMDLNPDEAVAAGWLKEGSPGERVLRWMLNHSLDRSEKVIVLDRFMQDRMFEKHVAAEKVKIVPPWSHSEDVCYCRQQRDEFRRKNALEGKYVVMYSGNHSPCHPLKTVLDAAVVLRDREDIIFVFVGGGSEFSRVKDFKETRGLSNILCLPYQPLSVLSASLSSADLHLVVMGDPFVGMIHPCKVYNILHLGIPFAYIGPARSHVGDLLQRLEKASENGSFRHGDVEGFVSFVSSRAAALGVRSNANVTIATEFSAARWVPVMVQEAEGLLDPSRRAAAKLRALVN